MKNHIFQDTKHYITISHLGKPYADHADQQIKFEIKGVEKVSNILFISSIHKRRQIPILFNVCLKIASLIRANARVGLPISLTGAGTDRGTFNSISFELLVSSQRI